jgi:hypothetical protein
MEAEGSEDEEKATEAKIAAADAMDSGDFATAVEKYSEAIRVWGPMAGKCISYGHGQKVTGRYALIRFMISHTMLCALNDLESEKLSMKFKKQAAQDETLNVVACSSGRGARWSMPSGARRCSS